MFWLLQNSGRMKHGDTAKIVLGIIGNIFSCGLFMSPVPAFCRIIKWRDTRGFSAIPYAMTTLNCLLWILYGMPFVQPDSIPIVSINSFGLVVEIVYLTIFFTFCHHNKKRLQTAGLVLLNVTFFIMVAALTLSLAHTGTQKSDTIGTLCIIFNVVMYASPLSIMMRVIKEKSVKYMPFWLSFATTINAAVWTAYGCLPVDRNIIVPNGLGTFLGICQLILYSCYFTSTKWDDDPEQENQREREVKDNASADEDV